MKNDMNKKVPYLYCIKVIYNRMNELSITINAIKVTIRREMFESKNKKIYFNSNNTDGVSLLRRRVLLSGAP